MKPISFLSFDVEALPGRAEKDHVDRLMWGKVDGGEYGVRKICEILHDYNLKANFLIDLSACALHGDKPVAEVGKYILGEGHELHTHLHSEWLVRTWGIKGVFNGPPGLDQLDEDLNLSFLQYSYLKFFQLFGRTPDVFRGGGFTFNGHTVKAAGEVGFRGLSNFNTHRHEQMLAVGQDSANNEPFRWDNGLVELPVDFSPEPLSFDINKYFGWFDRVQDRKKIKTFNLTMHSWSLLKKTGNFFDAFSPAHEDRLRYICEHLSEHTEVMGYSEYLDATVLPPVSLEYFKYEAAALNAGQNLVACNICRARFTLGNNDVCPGCGGRARHRQVVDVLNTASNPFTGQRVLACFANTVEKNSILGTAKEVLNFDVRPLQEVDFQMDIQNMEAIEDESFDGFIALHVLNHVKDDRAALREILRVLRPGGVALLTVPYRAGERTMDTSDILEHYGAENYEKYGVASYRRYGLGDVAEMFSEFFDLRIVNGFDPVTNTSMKVFMLSKSLITS
ncbi:MAG: methyltransferase domain-containing protein [Achromobacter sp.]|uniref:methyltransferase domain-containing protein n=1 Tax=Achromobacter sp. TaxID=134375 RepID=UPI0012CB4A9A|nr:methyltransferase domain-containing protein [Achromobacter sp.]